MIVRNHKIRFLVLIVLVLSFSTCTLYQQELPPKKPEIIHPGTKPKPEQGVVHVTDFSVNADEGRGKVELNWTFQISDNSQFSHTELSWQAESFQSEPITLETERDRIISDLTNDIEYTFILKIIDINLTVLSQKTIKATPDGIPPGDISLTNYYSTYNDDCGALRMLWARPFDPDFDHVEITYQKASNTDPSLIKKKKISNIQTGYFLGDLDGGCTYDVILKSVDTVGNKSAGVSITQTITYEYIDGFEVGSNGCYYTVSSYAGDNEDSDYKGLTDVLVQKYDESGTRLFSKVIGTEYNDLNRAWIFTDKDNNVYLKIFTEGSLNGVPNRGGLNCFLTKLDKEGTVLWTRLLEYSTEEVYVDKHGITTWIDDFSPPYETILLKALDPEGTEIVNLEIPAPEGPEGTRWIEVFPFSLDEQGNIYQYYSFTENNSYNTESFVHIIKYGPDGTRLWLKKSVIQGEIIAAPGYPLVLSDNDSIYLSGLNILADSDWRYIIKKLSTAEGSELWSKTYPPSQHLFYDKITADNSGNILLHTLIYVRSRKTLYNRSITAINSAGTEIGYKEYILSE